MLKLSTSRSAHTDALPTEEEVMAFWSSESSLLLSIACITYNHQRYIQDAMRGFLLQKTSFPFEIVVHDDASTDGTTQILQEYEARYPSIIRLIVQKTNSYSKGHRPLALMYGYLKGRYIAVCEGDDYWTDPFKIQIQVDALEKNPLIDLAIHPALEVNQTNGDERVIGLYRDENGIVPVSDIIGKKFGQIPTASTVIRRSIYDRFKCFYDKNPYLTVGDIYLHIFGAEQGGAWYSSQVSCIYRLFSNNSWRTRQAASSQKRVEHVLARVDSFIALKSELSSRYDEDIDATNREWLLRLFKGREMAFSSKLAYFKKYHNIFKGYEKLIVFIFCIIPTKLLENLIRIKYILLGRRIGRKNAASQDI